LISRRGASAWKLHLIHLGRCKTRCRPCPTGTFGKS
jgi:hypothetical protein